jgi:hypothetical protein
MKRTLDIDPAHCPQCEGRLEPIAIITRDDIVQRILSHLNLPASPSVQVARWRGTWATSAWTTGWWGWIPSHPTCTKRSEVHRVMRAWTRRRRTVERGEQAMNSAALRSPQG